MKCFWFAILIFPIYGNSENCWNDINFKKTTKILSKVPIRLLPLDIEKEGVNFFYGIFKNNTKGFYKVKNRQRASSVLTAVRMYHFSRLMEFDFVPPTSILMGNPIQLYIDHDDKKGNTLDFLDKNLIPIEKADIYTYYFLFSNLDPSSGNILIGEKCNKPALVDNDWADISAIKYGDYPFRLISNYNSLPNFRIQDFQNFPFHKVNSLKFSNVNELRNYFVKQNIRNKYFLNNFEYLEDKILHIVKYKSVFWIKMNAGNTYFWKNFLPKAVSKKTVKNLKKINRRKLNNIFDKTSYIESHGFKLNKYFRNSYISMILHRRDILLKEYSKLPKH